MPDWLTAELVVSTIGIFGGGYGGVRLGSVARIRLEIRKRVLDEVENPWKLFDELRLLTDHKNAHPWLESALAHWEVVDKLNDEVELLPWTDRASWSRLILNQRVLFQDSLSDFVEVVKRRQFGQMSDEDVAQFFDDFLESTAKRVGREQANKALTLPWGPAGVGDGSALSEFKDYLRRQIRPSQWRRAQDWNYRLQLAKSRPTPWPWRV